MRRSRDRNGQISYYVGSGSGLFDIASNISSKLPTSATSETAKKIGKAAAEKAIVKGSEEVGAAVGRKIAKKIDGGKTNELAGNQIVKLLQKPNISQKFDELLLI